MDGVEPVRARRRPGARLLSLGFVLASLALALLSTASATLAAYTFEALGTFGEMASEPAAINDAGRVTGTLTGT